MAPKWLPASWPIALRAPIGSCSPPVRVLRLASSSWAAPPFDEQIVMWWNFVRPVA